MKENKKENYLLTSGQLIDALKAGHKLRRNPYTNGDETYEFIQKQGDVYFVSGWGSACGNADDRLLLIVKHPEHFSISPEMVCDGCMAEINDTDKYTMDDGAYFCEKCSDETLKILLK